MTMAGHIRAGAIWIWIWFCGALTMPSRIGESCFATWRIAEESRNFYKTFKKVLTTSRKCGKIRAVDSVVLGIISVQTNTISQTSGWRQHPPTGG
jgi:hypothetical protein